MATLTRDVLAERLAEHAEITKLVAKDEVRWFFDQITAAITSGEDVSIHGFGAFKTSTRGARMARNPRTGESVPVAARKVVRFQPSTTLSAALKAAIAPAKKGGRAKAK